MPTSPGDFSMFCASFFCKIEELGECSSSLSSSSVAWQPTSVTGVTTSFASAGMDGKVCIACFHVCQCSILHFALTSSLQIVLWDQHCGRRRVRYLVVYSSSFAHSYVFFHLQVWDTMNPELFDSGDSAAPSGMSAPPPPPPPELYRQFAFDFLILQASTHPWRLMFSGCATVIPPLSVC